MNRRATRPVQAARGGLLKCHMSGPANPGFQLLIDVRRWYHPAVIYCPEKTKCGPSRPIKAARWIALWSVAIFSVAAFGFAATAIAQSNAAPAAPFKVEETLIGKWDSDARSVFALSRDGRHVAYASHTSCSSIWFQTKVHIVLDGQEDTGCHEAPMEFLALSHDGKRLAYVTGKQKKWHVVVDDQPGPDYDGILDAPPTFSPDGQRVAYGANKGGKWFVVVDGREEGPGYDAVAPGTLIFSPDSKRLAYWAKSDKQWFTVVDGKPGASYAGLKGSAYLPPDVSLGFTGDGQHADYIFWNDKQWTVVVDGEAGTETAGLRWQDGPPSFHIIFMPDTRHTVYLVWKDKQWTMVTFAGKDGRKYFVANDGKVASGKWFDVGTGSPVLAPDGKHFGYVAEERVDGKWTVVVDSRVVGEYYDVGGEGLIFSPDENHVAYSARKTNIPHMWTVAIDGNQGPEYNDVVDGSVRYSPDGHLEFLAERDKQLYRVKYTPLP
jgi:hypothetical protein